MLVLPALAAQARAHRRGTPAAVQRNRGFSPARPFQTRDAPGRGVGDGGAVSRLSFCAVRLAVLAAAGAARARRRPLRRTLARHSRRLIEELRQAVGENELRTIPSEFAPGDAIQIAEGTLRGLRAVVSRVMPARERVAVLMEFLGRQTMIELPASFLVKEGEGRAEIL
jgi:hypothetical protein